MAKSLTNHRLRVYAVVSWLAIAASAVAADTISRDSRILRDLARLRLEDIRADHDGEAILLTRIRVAAPAAGSGNFGATLDVTVDVDDTLSGNFTKKQWRFTRNLEEHAFTGLLDVAAEPYETIGFANAILRVSGVGGTVQILDTYVIPSDWTAAVREAYSYGADHPGALDATADATRSAALIELLHAKNSMLALSAARALAADRTNMARIVGEIKASKGIRQAAILLAFLQSAKPVNGRIYEIGGSLMAAIGEARRPDDLRGFALAASCAGKSREATADDFLMGIARASSLENLTVAERLQPILIRHVRTMFVRVDPELSDAYVASLVGLGRLEKRSNR